MNKDIEDLQIDYLCATLGNEIELKQAEEIRKKNKVNNNFKSRRFR